MFFLRCFSVIAHEFSRYYFSWVFGVKCDKCSWMMWSHFCVSGFILFDGEKIFEKSKKTSWCAVQTSVCWFQIKSVLHLEKENYSNKTQFTRCFQICPRPPPNQPPPQTRTIHEHEPPETERCDACQRRDPAEHKHTSVPSNTHTRPVIYWVLYEMFEHYSGAGVNVFSGCYVFFTGACEHVM